MPSPTIIQPGILSVDNATGLPDYEGKYGGQTEKRRMLNPAQGYLIEKYGPAWEGDPNQPGTDTGYFSPMVLGMPQGPGGWGQGEANRVAGLQGSEAWGVGDARARDQRYMDWLKQRAGGQGLDATRIGAEQRAGSRSDLLSYMASRGGQSAAAQRDAQYGIGTAAQGIRAQEAVATEEEKQRYRQMVAEEQARQWESESADANRRQSWGMGQEGLRQGALGMGMDESYARYKQFTDSLAQKRKQSIAEKERRQKEQASDEATAAGYVGAGASLLRGFASDVRAKSNIRPAQSEARALLEALSAEGPKKYDYREGFGDDEQFGPMAQTLEKAGPMGRSMVGKDKGGMRYLKAPEMVKGLAAALAEQQRELQDLRRSIERRGPSGATGRVPTRETTLGSMAYKDRVPGLQWERRLLSEGDFLDRPAPNPTFPIGAPEQRVALRKPIVGRFGEMVGEHGGGITTVYPEEQRRAMLQAYLRQRAESGEPVAGPLEDDLPVAQTVIRR